MNEPNNCTFYTAHFDLTTAQIVINCVLKYALRRGTWRKWYLEEEVEEELLGERGGREGTWEKRHLEEEVEKKVEEEPKRYVEEEMEKEVRGRSAGIWKKWRT